ncbi:hypothetical protein [Zoogloea sp. 1C4]|uniref:hypothetical protein n=1 Tax=Zoogloea sp. 1C4 TaxID=2570190 RepID=UPI001291B7EA|nr:hypothetical protein [Zoogloea sp. 1C4]
MEHVLFVWASGRIQYGTALPHGAIEVARGEPADLMQAVLYMGQTNQQHGYWEVPSVAALQDDPRRAVDALIAWTPRFRAALKEVEEARNEP